MTFLACCGQHWIVTKRCSHPWCSVKVVLDVNVGVEQVLSIRCQIHPVEDQVLKCLLQVRFPDQHRSHHLASTENNLEWIKDIMIPKQTRKTGFMESKIPTPKLFWVLSMKINTKHRTIGRQEPLSVPAALGITLTYSWPLVQRTSSSWSGPRPCALNFPNRTTCGMTQTHWLTPWNDLESNGKQF